MKKLLVLLMVLVMAISVSAANVELPEELTAPKNNYSASSTFSFSIDNPEVLVEFLDSMGAITDTSGSLSTFDYDTLLKTLLNCAASAEMKANISEDYNKIDLWLGMTIDYDVQFNQNFLLGTEMKFDVWVKLDISNPYAPELIITLNSPFSTKYTYINAFENLDEETKLMVSAMVKMFLNKGFIDGMNEVLADCYNEKAQISFDDEKYTIKLNNEAYWALCEAMSMYMSEYFAAVVPGTMPEAIVMPEFDFLGEDGYVIEYYNDGRIKEVCNISIDIAEVLSVMQGEAVPMEMPVIEFTIMAEGKIFDEGKTIVDFPELTEENSLELIEAFSAKPEEDYYGEVYEIEYPLFYASAFVNYMPEVEGKIYVPFRALLEDAYGGNVNIGFDNGLVTVTSEYFTEFEKLSFKVGESKVNVDGTDFEVGEIILKDGVTYVSSDFFEIVFKWQLDSASYDMLYDEYYFAFFTETMEYWIEEMDETVVVAEVA